MCLQHSESLFKILYIIGAKFCFYVSKIASKEKCSAERVSAEAEASRDTIGSSSAAAAAGCPARH